VRILFLSNIPTPYQLDFLGAMAGKADIRAVFLWQKISNHEWAMKYPSWLHILDYKNSRSGWEKLKAILDEFRPEVVIVGGYRLPLAHRVKWYAFRRAIRFYYWLEKPLPSRGVKVFFRSIAWRLTLPYARGILCIGSQAENAYRAFSRRTLILPYSIDFSRYSLRLQEPAHLPLKFLFVGQYIHRKGVLELLDAFSSVSPEIASLSLVGSGEFKEAIMEYAQRFPHIHDLGFAEPDKLPQLFSEHDVFILPSRHDGWAVVIAEALAVGLPVIGTLHTAAFLDLAASRDWGLTCEVDTNSIKQAVEYYLMHPELVRPQGAKGREALAHTPAIAENAAQSLLQYLG
jgi:glycosyltransferase involved in cell wall biosynthesis